LLAVHALPTADTNKGTPEAERPSLETALSVLRPVLAGRPGVRQFEHFGRLERTDGPSVALPMVLGRVGSDTGNTQTDEALNGPTRLTFVTLIR
jgi:hypothetical protein